MARSRRPAGGGGGAAAAPAPVPPAPRASAAATPSTAAGYSSPTTSGVHIQDLIRRFWWIIVIPIILLVLSLSVRHETRSGYRESAPRPPAVAALKQAPRRIPLDSAPVALWPKVMLEPSGRTALIPVPPGKTVSTNCSGCETHCVYDDGRDIVSPCPSGFLWIYIRETAGTAHPARYALH